MKTKRELIEEEAIEILKRKLQGIHTTQLIKSIRDCLPDVRPKAINGSVWKLSAIRPEVYKPSRVLFRHLSF